MEIRRFNRHRFRSPTTRRLNSKILHIWCLWWWGGSGTIPLHQLPRTQDPTLVFLRMKPLLFRIIMCLLLQFRSTSCSLFQVLTICKYPNLKRKSPHGLRRWRKIRRTREAIEIDKRTDYLGNVNFNDSVSTWVWNCMLNSMSEIRKYDGKNCTYAHLKAYGVAMAQYGHNDKLLVQTFPKSLTTVAIAWFAKIKIFKIKRWTALAHLFFKQYKFIKNRPWQGTVTTTEKETKWKLLGIPLKVALKPLLRASLSTLKKTL